MSDDNYKPSGELQGDDRPMPDRGTSTGLGVGGSYGASIDVNATNSMGSAHLPSDAPDDCCPPGDAGLRFTSSGHSTTDPGQRMSGTDSDPVDDTTPADQRSNA